MIKGPCIVLSLFDDLGSKAKSEKNGKPIQKVIEARQMLGLAEVWTHEATPERETYNPEGPESDFIAIINKTLGLSKESQGLHTIGPCHYIIIGGEYNLNKLADLGVQFSGYEKYRTTKRHNEVAGGDGANPSDSHEIRNQIVPFYSTNAVEPPEESAEKIHVGDDDLPTQRAFTQMSSERPKSVVERVRQRTPNSAWLDVP